MRSRPAHRAERPAPGVTDSESTIDRVLREGPLDFRAAAREAGAPSLSYWSLLRAWRAGALDGVRLGGRILTSAAAIRRWIAHTNERPLPSPRPDGRRRRTARPRTSAAARDYLRARGLPAGGAR